MDLISLGLSPPREVRFDPLGDPSIPLNNSAALLFLGGGGDTESNEIINDQSAMQISTVFCCIRILAESVASLPLRLFTLTQQGKIQEVNSPLFHLLQEPNEEMSFFTWIETVMVHLALTGNSYCEIERAASGQPVAIWPLSPRQTVAMRHPGTGLLFYRTTDGGVSRDLDAKNVLHTPLTTFDGIVGLSPIMQAKRTLGASIAAEKFGSRLFANYAMPQLALMTKATVKSEDKAKMRRDWEALQSGSSQHRVAVLDGEMTIEKLSLTAEEAQFLETRKYARSDIAALFRVPAHMVGETQKLSNSNTENMNQSFIQDCLRPYLSRLEAEITRKLLPRLPGQARTLTVSFDVRERLRGDSAAQAAWATAGRNGGWLTANDVRRDQGLNEGGPELDSYLVPVNYQNAESLLHAPAQKDAVTNV